MPDSSPDLSESPDTKTNPRLIELFRAAIRSRHYSRRTEKSCWYWIRSFVRFHDLRHPEAMGAHALSKGGRVVNNGRDALRN